MFVVLVQLSDFLPNSSFVTLRTNWTIFELFGFGSSFTLSLTSLYAELNCTKSINTDDWEVQKSRQFIPIFADEHVGSDWNRWIGILGEDLMTMEVEGGDVGCWDPGSVPPPLGPLLSPPTQPLLCSFCLALNQGPTALHSFWAVWDQIWGQRELESWN